MKIRIRIGGFLLLWYIPRLTTQQIFLMIGVVLSVLINLAAIFFIEIVVNPTKPPQLISDSEKAVLLKLLEEPDMSKVRDLLEQPKANDKVAQKPDALSDRNSTTNVKPPDEIKNFGSVDVTQNQEPRPKTENTTPPDESTDEDRFQNNMNVQPFLKRNTNQKSVYERLTGQEDPSQQGFAGQNYELNTYKWEFAPYMLAWKNKMTSNWYRITSKIFFSQFARVGEILIYVKMNRQGQLVDSKVVDYNCDKSFVAPAYASVVNSFPLDPLPNDFPEDMLETTWTISITNQN